MKRASVNKRSVGCKLPLMNIAWSFIFAIYGGIAALWWLISPHGFPLTHPQFWANSGIPVITVVAAFLGIFALLRNRISLAKIVVVFFLGLTYAAFICALIIFPISFGPANGLRFLVFILFISSISIFLFLLAAILFFSHRERPIPYVLVVVVTAAAMLAGTGMVRAQQSLLPATIPLNAAVPSYLRNLSPSEGQFQTSVALNNDTEVWTEGATIQARCGKLGLQISPVLTFTSRSPDRFWTLFAPQVDRNGPRRYLNEQQLTENRVLSSYIDDDKSWLGVQGGGAEPLEIESYTHLPNPIYSHLNSYAELTIMEGEQLDISFSAARDFPIEFREASYPFGKPARMAYRDTSDRFLVVEASNAEKGPFKTIVEGRLERSNSLGLTLYDNGTPQCLITFKDWAAQASTQRSPTAGWGFPENSIQFQLLRSSDPQESPTGFIHVSLASTSTGRGFNSVGHLAGLYRNRMRIESFNSD